jgi:hypothetical protein
MEAYGNALKMYRDSMPNQDQDSKFHPKTDSILAACKKAKESFSAFDRLNFG